MTEELAQGHDALRVAMRDFARIMDRSGPEDMPVIAQKRIAFSQLYRDHMAKEDAAVRGLTRPSLPMEAEQAVRDHGRAIVTLFLRYSEHLKHWTPAMIAQDWTGYRAAVKQLQDSLHERMAWEEKHLHPIFARPSRRAA